MRIGIFNNINGDYDKLENSVEELLSKDVEGLFCLGNLISDLDFLDTYNKIDDLIGEKRASPEFRLDDGSKKCMDYVKTCSGHSVKHVFLFRGQNEKDFLKRISGSEKKNDQYAKEISDYLSFIMDFNFVLCGGSFRSASDSESCLEKTWNLFDQIKHVNKDLKIVFSGQSNIQGVYNIYKSEAIYSTKNKLLLKDNGKNYVVYPSSDKGGYALFDFNGPKETSQISLFK